MASTLSGTLRAGFGRADITPMVGGRLVGYGSREQVTSGVHDRLFARALVVEDAGGAWALVSCDLCFLFAETVAEIRRAVQKETGIPGEQIFVAATHTHAGPHDRHAQNWDRPLAEIIAGAVVDGYAARQPARLGTGYGLLYGYSINRRWLDKPVDPAIVALRLDDAQGNLLGLVSVFGCHSVVMGANNLQISGDWPGYAMTQLETDLGPGVTSLFFQGGAGDINPLVADVRRHLRNGQTVRAIQQVSAYYGPVDDPDAWGIGNRGEGTFAEVAELGAAYAEEVAYLVGTIATRTLDAQARQLWSEQVVIDATAQAGEHPQRNLAPLAEDIVAVVEGQPIQTELMLIGIGDLVLVGQPGEVFAETAVRIRMTLRQMGFGAPMLVSYANGWYLYLPEPASFVEGGYEPGWAATLNISRQFQVRAWDAISPLLARHRPR